MWLKSDAKKSMIDCDVNVAASPKNTINLRPLTETEAI